MARIRSIKPEAFTSETLAGCSIHARWTFAGLWCYVDDDGRGKANAGLVKAAVWPLDDDVTPKQIDGFLDELEAARIICRYEVDGKSYLHVVNFPEHQHPNRPVASKLPACSRRAHGGLTESAVSPHPKAPAEPPSAAVETPEVKDSAKSGRTPHRETEPAGQTALSEASVSAHGASTAKSSTTPPTPTPVRNEPGVGVGVGDVGGVPPTAGAARSPRRAQSPPSEAHVGTVVAAYVDGATGSGQPSPASRLKARVGKQARELLTDGYDIAVLIDSARRMGAGEWNDLAVQVRKDAASANGSRPGKQTNYSDEEYQGGW